MISEPEEVLAGQLRMLGIYHVREFVVAPPRKFRADFMVSHDLLIEVEGGAWINGRHSRGKGMESDCEKSALAAIAGYRVVRVTPAQIEDGRALSWIERGLAWHE